MSATAPSDFALAVDVEPPVAAADASMNFSPVSYRQARLDDSYDAIVVGSGVGGLATAVLLAKHGGKRVLVLERHFTAGGFTHAFRRPGFEWDVGVHYVGQVRDSASPVRQLFDHLTDGRLAWASMPDVYDRIVIGDRRYDFPTGVERFRDRMAGYFPSDIQAIDRYIDAIHASVRRSRLFFTEKVLPPFVGALCGRALRWPYLRLARRTTLSVLSGLTDNAELIGVLTGQWGNYGLPPGQSSFAMHATIADHYFDGGSYPVGGGSSILDSMGPLIERAGGAVVVRGEVASIMVEQERAIGVRMADGRVISAPLVISDAGAAETYGRLLPEHSSAVDEIRAGIARIGPSIGHVCLYLGLTGTTDTLHLEGTNLWLHPSADHDGNLQRFLDRPDSPLPSVYVSFPSAKDPTFEARHSGYSAIDVVTYVPYAWFTRWQGTSWRKRGAEYDAVKQQLSERLLDALYRNVPAVRGHVVHAELSTPLTTRHFTDHAGGAMYGLAHTPERVALRGLGPRTPVRGLYLTGADVAMCGVTGAAFGGVMAASAVLRRNLFRAVWE